MKPIKSALCSLLLVVSACSSEKEDKRWRNDLANQTINGVKNPYMVDENIYNYIATDIMASKNDDIYHDLCQFEVYSLNSERHINLKEYLNKFNAKKLSESPNNYFFSLDDGELQSQWILNNEVTQELFKPFDDNLLNDNFFSQTTFDRFQECIDFFRNKSSGFVKKYNLDLIEEARYDNFDKHEVVEVINNPNSFVKINLWRYTGGYIYFYDPQQQFLILLTFQPSS